MSNDHDALADTLHRYHRQMLLPDMGEGAQQRLGRAHVLVVGCGALGSVIIDSLARAGVGHLTIVDRDVVEITNLQRQVLYDEADVEQSIPKAEAARLKVEAINSRVQVTAHVDDFSHRNAMRFMAGVDLIVDGLDNFQTRYLINDLAVATHRPYVYGGAVGVTGLSMTIVPRSVDAQPQTKAQTKPGNGLVRWLDEEATPCLRCIFPEAPPPGSTPTCDTAGVLGPAVLTVAAHQAAQAIKLLSGNLETLDRSLWSLDMWSNETRRLRIANAASENCPCCGRGEFPYLHGEGGQSSTTLCGRNAVQIAASESGRVDLAAVAQRLAAHGDFRTTSHLLHGTFRDKRSPEGDPIQITLFPNGRAIIAGTSQPEVARAVYARFVGV